MDGVESGDRLAAMAEYGTLKAEQLARIGTRDNLLYATLAAYAAVFAAASSAAGRSGVLVAVPLVSLVLGWTYVTNDRKITEIGGYVKDHLAGQVSANPPRGARAFAWETRHRDTAGRRRSKTVQAAVDLLAFPGGGLAALVTLWAHGGDAPVLALSAVEVPALALLGWEVLRTARDARRPARERATPRPEET